MSEDGLLESLLLESGPTAASAGGCELEEPLLEIS